MSHTSSGSMMTVVRPLPVHLLGPNCSTSDVHKAQAMAALFRACSTHMRRIAWRASFGGSSSQLACKPALAPNSMLFLEPRLEGLRQGASAGAARELSQMGTEIQLGLPIIWRVVAPCRPMHTMESENSMMCTIRAHGGNMSGSDLNHGPWNLMGSNMTSSYWYHTALFYFIST